MLNDFGIFNIQNDADFNQTALKIFQFQLKNNRVYRRFVQLLGVDTDKINHYKNIPFLPIQFFKEYQVVASLPPYEAVFKSSGTTGMVRSRHYVKDLKIYEESFFRSFQYFYGDISQYTILALLPSYVEQGDSSLVYMTDKLIQKSRKKHSGFYLGKNDDLAVVLNDLDQSDEKILLLGVSYALLDLVEKQTFNLQNTIVMETGGMKGRRKEMLREELHRHLKEGFGVEFIHSEYGMTELLSQSYSKGRGIFKSPPWKKILIRDSEDPQTYLPDGKTGGINIIDLANIYSCSFIATQDLGKKTATGEFEILGRFDHSDVRGCNLLIFQN